MKKTLFITFCLLVLIETVCFFVLNREKRHASFLFDFSKKEALSKLTKHNYNEIHPLLGWASDSVTTKSNGYNVDRGHIMLQTQVKAKDTLKLYISGGSASDLNYDSTNWPIQLFHLLEKDSIPAEIRLAATGGYASGQEYLKQLDYFQHYKPDIHISYSGANEYLRPGYVSDFEMDFYLNTLKPNARILPNTVSFLQQMFKPSERVVLDTTIYSTPSDFWTYNMTHFKHLADAYNYKFIGVLQPVINYAGLDTVNINTTNNFMAPMYSAYYPSCKAFCAAKPFMFDYTEIFKGVKENPFIDDCHLKSTGYQKMVADSIYALVKPSFILAEDSISRRDYGHSE